MTQWIMPIAALLAGLTAITAGPAEAVVYCDYVGVPKGCVARPGVALRSRAWRWCGGVGVGVLPGAGAGAAGPGVREGTPANRGGPVNRAGRHEHEFARYSASRRLSIHAARSVKFIDCRLCGEPTIGPAVANRTGSLPVRIADDCACRRDSMA